MCQDCIAYLTCFQLENNQGVKQIFLLWNYISIQFNPLIFILIFLIYFLFLSSYKHAACQVALTNIFISTALLRLLKHCCCKPTAHWCSASSVVTRKTKICCHLSSSWHKSLMIVHYMALNLLSLERTNLSHCLYASYYLNVHVQGVSDKL